MAAAQVAGVIASAWFVWFHSVLPRLGWQSTASMIGEALSYVAIAWACGALNTAS